MSSKISILVAVLSLVCLQLVLMTVYPEDNKNERNGIDDDNVSDSMVGGMEETTSRPSTKSGASDAAYWLVPGDQNFFPQNTEMYRDTEEFWRSPRTQSGVIDGDPSTFEDDGTLLTQTSRQDIPRENRPITHPADEITSASGADDRDETNRIDLEVEAELISIIEPALCHIHSVTTLGDFMYVHCHPLAFCYESERCVRPHKVLMVFENKHPFDLLMIIATEEVDNGPLELISTPAHLYLYIFYGRIWKVDLENHQLTVWNKEIFGATFISANSYEGISIVSAKVNAHGKWEGLHLEVYDENEEIVQSLTMPRNSIRPDYVVQMANGNSVFHSVLQTYRFGTLAIRSKVCVPSIMKQREMLKRQNIILFSKSEFNISAAAFEVARQSRFMVFLYDTDESSDFKIFDRANLHKNASGLLLIPGDMKLQLITTIASNGTVLSCDLSAFPSLTKLKITLSPSKYLQRARLSSFYLEVLLIRYMDPRDKLIFYNTMGYNALTIYDSEFLLLVQELEGVGERVDIFGYDRKTGNMFVRFIGQTATMLLKLDDKIFFRSNI